MALTGLHVACCSLGLTKSLDSADPRNGPFWVNLLGQPIWSETLQSAGTTSRAASPQGYEARSLLYLTPSLDVFVAIGTSPDASKSGGDGPEARLFLQARSEQAIIVTGPMKVAWVPA